MKVLMVGVHRMTKGGMWTVVDNYLKDEKFVSKYNIKYIPTAVSGSAIKRIIYSIYGVLKVFFYTIFNRYDILHVHMSERMSVFRKGLIMKISRIRKPKIVIHMHGAEFEDWYKTLSAKKKNKVKRIINSANKVIILGKYWEEFVSSLMDDKTKVEVLYNAVQCPNENLYNINANNLLFLGAIGKRKGIYDLLQAMKIIKAENIKTKLLLYGPDTTDGIDKIIEDNELIDYVEYRGWLNADKKKEVFTKEIALNILPSYNEGLPMTILETMSYGIPNISTDVAAIPEVINKDNGYINKPGDYKKVAEDIVTFLSNKSIREELSNNSYKTIYNVFSIEKHIQNLSKIYEEM